VCNRLGAASKTETPALRGGAHDRNRKAEIIRGKTKTGRKQGVEWVEVWTYRTGKHVGIPMVNPGRVQATVEGKGDELLKEFSGNGGEKSTGSSGVKLHGRVQGEDDGGM